LFLTPSICDLFFVLGSSTVAAGYVSILLPIC
jgi:hypothetical protein